MNSNPDSTRSELNAEDRPRLTEKQLENWRATFPELRLASDEAVNYFRDTIQSRYGSPVPKAKETPSLSGENKNKAN